MINSKLDIYIANTIRSNDVNFGKLTVNEYYFSSHKTDGSRVLNGLQKLNIVGRGAQGMAVLYRRKADQKLVIIKEINTAEMSKDQRTMAINEANVLKILDHPNIIRYMANFEIDKNIHIMMEYADRGSLHDFIKTQKSDISASEVVRILAQIVSGLRFMHDKRILHRDLKTQNIFLFSRPNLVKIGDLGIAKVMTTHNQTVVGTCSYISPELCEARSYDEKSDIWSLGCCLYELMVRKRAFDGSNPLIIVKKIVIVEYKPISKDADYNNRLRHLVNIMIQKDPRKRPSSEELDEKLIPELQHSIDFIPIESDQEDESSMSHTGKVSLKSNVYVYSGDERTMSLVNSTMPPSKIKQIVTGDRHLLILTEDGVVYTKGSNDCGQLGNGSSTECDVFKDIPTLRGKPMTKVGAGFDFSAFLSQNGMVLTCGNPYHGCLGHGDMHQTRVPKVIEGLLQYTVTDIAVGYEHMLALTSDGDVYSWGSGRNGRHGHGHQETLFLPTKIASLIPYKQIYAGYDASIIGKLLYMSLYMYCMLSWPE